METVMNTPDIQDDTNAFLHEADGAAPAGDTPAAKTEADEGAGTQPDATAASN